jgi:flagellar protein FlaJ
MGFSIETQLLKNKWLRSYREKMDKNGLALPLSNWLAMAIGGSIAIGIAGFFLFQLIGLDNANMLAVILSAVSLDLTLGYPVFLEMRRLDAVERALPDALKQIADTLRAGGTYEFALRELASTDFGPLTKEIQKVLRKLDEGENMENSFRSLAIDNSESRLMRRSVTIIIDSLKSGASLSDVLDQISDDIRELRRIASERTSRTVMGVMLIVAAGAIVAPALFGLNGSVLEFLIRTAKQNRIAEIAMQTGGTVSIAQSEATLAFISFLIVFYIFIELVACSIMVALMRDGKAGKSIIYVPLLLLVGLMAYYGTRLFASLTILKGG